MLLASIVVVILTINSRNRNDMKNSLVTIGVTLILRIKQSRGPPELGLVWGGSQEYGTCSRYPTLMLKHIYIHISTNVYIY